VTRIFAKTDLMNFLLERASVTGLGIDRSGSSVAAFEHRYMPLCIARAMSRPIWATCTYLIIAAQEHDALAACSGMRFALSLSILIHVVMMIRSGAGFPV
jgi:hypothetical protein